MECPYCSTQNIDGVDECIECHADLSFADELEERGDIERELLRLPLGDLMNHAYVVVGPDCSVRDTLKKWSDGGYHCAMIVDRGRIVGIFTERDVLCKLADNYERHADQPISRYMTPDPVTFEARVPVAFGLNRMMIGDYRHIPIKKDGQLAGVVSIRDILAYLTKRFADVIGAAPSA